MIEYLKKLIRGENLDIKIPYTYEPAISNALDFPDSARFDRSLVEKSMERFAENHPFTKGEDEIKKYLRDHANTVREHKDIYKEYKCFESLGDCIYRLDQMDLGAAMYNSFFNGLFSEEILNKITDIAIEKGADYTKFTTFYAASFEDWQRVLREYPTWSSLTQLENLENLREDRRALGINDGKEKRWGREDLWRILTNEE